MISRASTYAFDTHADVTTCSAEDLVVLKAFASRPQDWLDIEGIVVRQRARLDRTLIAQELRLLLELKEDSGPEAILQALFQKHS